MTQMTQNDPDLAKCSSGTPPQAPLAQAVADNSDLLDERQRVALELMLTGATLTAVANAVSIGRKTLYRWRTEDPAFQAELHRRRHEILDSSVDRFRSVLGKSLDLLEKQIRDPYATTALRAARTLLVISGVSRLAVPRSPTPTHAGGAESSAV
jgi:hypothetical protein